MGPKPIAGVIIRRGSLGIDTHIGKGHVKMKVDIGVIYLQAKEFHGLQGATKW